MSGLDVRVVANIVLRQAQIERVAVTNLHLNKALYFMHVDRLRECGQPLVSAKIEAWEYGPVFREVYNQFKRYRGGAIRDLARRPDYETGELVVAWDDIPADYQDYIRELARFYIRIPASVLVDMSHAKGGAWDAVWNNSGPINLGMEITDDKIRQFELTSGARIHRQ
ncbi:Panacea domain-containing protein [Roseivivax halodurans]|uniref:Panacea domain-containing protein n=1 Tax=Roseivivax halodurans TaxID=93683 RepID=UPI000A00604F|nr:type II toxin-antitoxin system antitoxin SocA domain-containing protein [Roseivivax halodurans]